MMEEKKDLIWVPISLKEAWENATSEEAQKQVFFHAIEERKLDIRAQIESLEDELLLFKGIGLRYKTELEKAYNEQGEQIEKIWKDFNAGDKIHEQAKKINSSLKPLIETVEQINKQLDKISTYKINDMISLIERFNGMSDTTRRMLELLINSEKRAE